MAEKIFFRSTALSLVGDNLTRIALATLLYNITGDAKAVASLFIFQFFAIFVSGFLVPSTIEYFPNKKKLIIAIDIARGFTVLSLIFFQYIWYIYLIVFIDALFNGYYHPTKQSGIQGLISSDKRINYIASIQSITNIIQISIPALAGLLISFIKIEVFFLIDMFTFLFAAIILLKLDDWSIEEKKNKSKKFLEKTFNAYQIIFSNAKYYQPLMFRFILLFSLSAFSVIQIITVTRFSNNSSLYGLPSFVTFSFALGALSSVGSLGSIVVSYLIKNRYKIHNLRPAFVNGIILLSLGFAFWMTPVQYKYSWLLYLLGTFFLFSGLTFSRIGLHTAGLELTEKNIFIEIVSSSDALARLWQAFISYAVIGLFELIPLFVLVGFSTLFISLAIFPAIKIIKLLKIHQTTP